MQLMECGAHGLGGQLVAQRVDTVSAKEKDTVIIPSPRTMVHPARVLDTIR